jgi:hypothetical protein
MDGEVKPRILRNCGKHPFWSGMRYVSNVLVPHLKNLSHLVKNTEAIIKQVKNLHFPFSCVFYKFDVKDYYLSGKHSEISNIVESFLADKKESRSVRLAVGSLTYRVLDEQYVQTTKRYVVNGITKYERKIHKVILGTGMGLLFSGDVSDCVYYHNVEQKFLANAGSQLVYYARYRDDVIMVLDGPQARTQELVKQYLSSNSIFKIEIESVSQSSCSFLDLELFKGQRHKISGHLDYKLYVKPTALWRPLSPASLHAEFMHTAWPLGQIQRLRNRFSDVRLAEREVEIYIKKLSVSGIERPVQTTSNRPHVLRASSWVVFPYRPEYHRGLSEVIHNINSEFNIYARYLFACDSDLNILSDDEGQLPSAVPIIGVSWTLDAPNLLRRFATSNKLMERSNPETYSIFTQVLADQRAACVEPFV